MNDLLKLSLLGEGASSVIRGCSLIDPVGLIWCRMGTGEREG